MALRYYIEPETLRGVEWRLEIHDSDFVGTATEVTGGPEGFGVDYEGDTGEPYTPVFPSSLTFDFLIEDSGHEGFLSQLVNAREERFSVVLKRGSGLPVEWAGWLIPDQIIQKDEAFPYHCSLYAVDGIARMKDVDYVDPVTGNPFTGRETFLEHFYHCFDHIGLMSLAGVTMPTVRFRTNVNLYDTGMVTTTSPVAQAEADHDRFINKDDEGNAEYFSVYDVLDALCMRFGARLMFSRGAYTLLQVGELENTTQNFHTYNAAGALIGTESAVDIDIDIDYSTESGAKKRRGGTYSFLQPLKKVCIDYNHITSNNKATGLSWPSAGTGYRTLPGKLLVDAVDTTQINLVLNFKVKSNITVVAANTAYPIHKYVFKVFVKVGAYYLKRNVTGNFYNVVPEEAFWWTGSEQYIETHSAVITQLTNLEDIWFQLKITSPFLSPGFADGQNIELKILLDRVEIPGLGNLSYNSFFQITDPDYSGTINWNLPQPVVKVENEGLGLNPDSNTLRTCAVDDEDGNTGVEFYDVWLGDGPAPFSVSRLTVGGLATAAWQVGGTGTTYTIDEWLAREILSIRQTAAKVFQGTVLSQGYSPYYRIVNGSTAYWPLRLSFSAFRDEWTGEFVKVGRVFTISTTTPVSLPGGPIKPPKVGDPPAPPPTWPGPPVSVPVNETEGLLAPYTLGEAIASATLDGDAVAALVNAPTPNELTIDPVSFAFAKAGDKFKLINPGNGQNQLLTVAVDYVPGAATLKITEDLTDDYPHDSLLMNAFRFTTVNPVGWAEQFTGVTGTFVTVTAGTLPNPAVVSAAEIVRRVKVYRGGGGAIRSLYNVTGGFTIDYALSRINFDEKLRSENVLVEVI